MYSGSIGRNCQVSAFRVAMQMQILRAPRRRNEKVSGIREELSPAGAVGAGCCTEESGTLPLQSGHRGRVTCSIEHLVMVQLKCSSGIAQRAHRAANVSEITQKPSLSRVSWCSTGTSTLPGSVLTRVQPGIDSFTSARWLRAKTRAPTSKHNLFLEDCTDNHSAPQ